MTVLKFFLKYDKVLYQVVRRVREFRGFNKALCGEFLFFCEEFVI